MLEGLNDFKTTHFGIAKDWYPTKNGDLKPTHVKPGSNKKVWWQYNVNSEHEWPASVVNRSNGTGCIHCRRESFKK